jgi:SH3-like domain-containing protein
MKKNRSFIITFALTILVCGTAHAGINEAESEEGKGTSGLPVPRFASLRSNEVNMRTGPGTRYPIEWVFMREGLPVEIIAEYEIWRRVRDPDGAEGWVHKNALSGKRTAIVTGNLRDLLESSDAPTTTRAPATIVAHLEPGAVGQILSCTKEWCRLKFEGIKGYLTKSDFWGVEPNEEFN